MPANESEKILKFVTDLAGEKFLKIEKDLGAGFYRLNVSEAEKRQARHDIRSVEDCLIELLRNARDGGARRIFIASFKSGDNERNLRVIDDGQGIPDHVHMAVFEPRVTSKLESVIEDRYGVHGRGMALYSIKSGPSSIRLVASAAALGSSISFSVDTYRLTERADQSTYPKVRTGKEGTEVTGPRNIPRLMVEFALDHPDMRLFLGTPSEILSSMILEGRAILSSSSIPLGSEHPFWLRAAAARDARELMRIAETYFDIRVSERNAHRVLAGDVRPSAPVDPLLYRAGKKGGQIIREGRYVAKNIPRADLETFAQAIIQNFRSLGERYFLEIDGEPSIKCGRESITVKLKIRSDQQDI